ncbi:ABC transporter ATP-binding protein [Enterococcus rivorum]|uniref:ABC transporter ATP-binding protein n=1 Tax=Enterococcus rivorum TaxID=762845 RepID=A0A1E5KVG1_9ENTE|nr:ABC transporter ATP-binding protein [Enterococcus rivorum]MBP2098407.1 ABC-2 type transport system ATP-binding protein [Enterococcus rivorum]OEH81810.1 ABC transporter ATP-binding protein [Enterococcus rivorum]
MKKKYAIKVNGVCKDFKLPTESTSSLKRTIVNYFKGIKGYREQKVLRDISFEVEKGDFFGVVGRNGSGKSTLLKIISEIYVPEKGKVEVDGKLVSFIELGVGFNHELTGKENVYLNGALLGFSTDEIDEIYDDIVEFAELTDFMNQKLKNYSSGMQVRLAFSVAIQSKSDILVLDEVLAVGDEAFQRKCNDYFMQAREDKKTIVLVTHSMDAVRKYCNKAMMIDKGEVKIIGTPEDVANQYSLSNVTDSGSATIIENSEDSLEEPEQEEFKKIENLKVELLSDTIIDSENSIVEFAISYDVIESMRTYVAFSMVDIDRNVWLYNDNSYDDMTVGKGQKKLRYKCKLNNINGCTIKLNVAIRNDNDEPFAFADKENSPIIIVAKKDNMGKSERISSSGIIKRNGTWISK